MRLVHYHQVPTSPREAILHVISFGPINRGNDLRAILPRVGPVRISQIQPSDDVEALTESVVKLTLPLESEVGGRDNQASLDEAPELELSKQQPGHDCLARSSVISEQEADTRKGQHEVV